jgi:FkbM family methyltransferase
MKKINQLIKHTKNFAKRLPPYLLIHLIAWRHYWGGEPEIRILKSLVDPNKNSVDIGANNGVYTYFLSRLSRHVFVYEPNPKLVNFLEELAFTNISIYPVAVSDAKGTAILSIPKGENSDVDKLGSLRKMDIHSNEVSTFEVPVVRLDDENISNIGFMKIDVEGYEEFVISGAADILVNQKPNLLIEIEQRHIDKDIHKIFSKVLSLGYEGYFLLNRKLVPLDLFSVEEHQQIANLTGLAALGTKYICNFIFKPKYT